MRHVAFGMSRFARVTSVAAVGAAVSFKLLLQLPCAHAEAPSGISKPAVSRGEAALRAWSGGTVSDRLNRLDPTACERQRRVLVVVGITGAGKSSTANTLCGRTVQPFKLSSSITSVTQAVALRDYTFMESDWRVIDTPGLLDTNKRPEEVRGELLRLASFAPHGISAFIVVVPRGRFTPEHRQALADTMQLFGPQMADHAVVAVTSATDLSEGRNLLPRDVLLEEINQLPLGHLLRSFVERVRFRLVPVENRADPQRQVSRLSLHQRILELEDANGGARYDASGLADSSAASATAAAKSLSACDGASGSGATTPFPSQLRLGRCVQSFKRGSDGRLRFLLDCECEEPAVEAVQPIVVGQGKADAAALTLLTSDAARQTC